MEDKIEIKRKKLIKKFRRSQWKLGALAVVYAVLAIFWHQAKDCLIVLAAITGMIMLAEEVLIDRIKNWPAASINELDRLFTKYHM